MEAADARERVEWHRTAGLALMVGGLFNSRDPWEVVPARYRPGTEGKADNASPGPPQMTEDERALRQEIGLANLGAMLRQVAGG